MASISVRNLYFADMDTHDDTGAMRSIYDTDNDGEEPWFLPPDDNVSPVFIPTRCQTLVDPADWRAAEASLAPELARAAAELARLDALVEQSGEGMVLRLALIESEAIILAEGGRIRRESIGRDMMGRATTPDMHADMGRARWALRRLPLRPAAPQGLREFLGLHEAESNVDIPDAARLRPIGPEFDAAEHEFHAGMHDIIGSHPITQAAFGFRLWQLAGISPAGVIAEPAVAAGRIAAQDNRQLGFAPLASTRSVWVSGGSPQERLTRWITATRNGAMTAQMTVRRVDDWANQTKNVVAHWKGDTPMRMVDALRARPLLSTEDVATQCNVSRDSAERQLARMLESGLIRELTGQGRFRLWSATV